MENKRKKSIIIGIISAVLSITTAVSGVSGYYATHKEDGTSDNVSQNAAQTLPAPTNLRVEGNVLRWDAVDNAIAYAVAVNGELKAKVTETEYGLNGLPPGEYGLTVSSAGGGTLIPPSFPRR
jgi:hypothetical protein